jgi:hypothetical protein
MTIEVRQMLIKSTVLQQRGTEETGGGPSQDMAETKEEILEECKQLIVDMLREEKER